MKYTKLSFPENSLFLVTGGASFIGSNLCEDILAVAHEQFKDLSVADFDKLYTGQRKKVLVDMKSMLDKNAFREAGYVYWRL